MNKIFNKTILLVIISATFLGGCRDTEEYQRLAKAGTAYVQSLDTLLKFAGEIKVDTTSEQLLNLDRISNQTIENYNKITEQDIRRLEILKRIRRHNSLLAKYFVLLDQLASSDAPDRAQEEITGIVNTVNSVSSELVESEFFTNQASSIISALPKLIISSQIEGALRDELEMRADTINKELKIQEFLLSELSKSISTDITIIENSKQTRLVIRPLTKEEVIAKPDNWINDRNQILTTIANVEELANAEQAAASFRMMFNDFVEGKFDQARFNYYLGQIESFLTFVESLKQ